MRWVRVALALGVLAVLGAGSVEAVVALRLQLAYLGEGRVGTLVDGARC